MKQFNLEEYLKKPSRKVVTRGGSPVKIHCTNYNTDQPIIAEIEGTNWSESFNKDGKWLHLEDSEKDLFFAHEKHEGWVNIYKAGSDRSSSSRIYPTEEDAKKGGNKFGNYVITTKIEWEE